MMEQQDGLVQNLNLRRKMNNNVIKILLASTLIFGCQDQSKVAKSEKIKSKGNLDTIVMKAGLDSLKIEKSKMKAIKKERLFEIESPQILEQELDGFFLGYQNKFVIFKDYAKGNVLYVLDESTFTLKNFKIFDEGFNSFFVNDLGVVGSFKDKMKIYFFDGKTENIDVGFEVENITSDNELSNFFFNKKDTRELYVLNTNRNLKKIKLNGSDLCKIEKNIYFTSSSNQKDVYNINLDLFRGENFETIKEVVSGFFQDGWSFSPTGRYFLHSKELEGSYTTKIIDLNTNKTLFELGDKSEYFSYYSKMKNTFVIHK